MANTPTQHCVHPGRQTNHSPLRRTASARAASTIWISAPSAAGNRREYMSEAYRLNRARSFHFHPLIHGSSQPEIFIDRAVVRKRGSSRRIRDDRIDGHLARKKPLHLLSRRWRGSPFHHV